MPVDMKDVLYGDDLIYLSSINIVTAEMYVKLKLNEAETVSFSFPLYAQNVNSFSSFRARTQDHEILRT